MAGQHGAKRKGDRNVTANMHAAASKHMPGFITAPGETDTLMVIVVVFLVVSVLLIGNLFLTLHSMPERMAHKGQKLQFEIVAVLCLLSLFTHVHLYWVLGLLLALIDIPDFTKPLNRIAGSVEKLAGIDPEVDEGPFHAAHAKTAGHAPDSAPVHHHPAVPEPAIASPAPQAGTPAGQKA